MRLHRFYADPQAIELGKSIWIKDSNLRNQWQKVLRYREGDQVVLFDGVQTERLYKIISIERDAVKLDMVTEFDRQLPDNHTYLFFSLLKKDKNYWVVQKATELGVTNFVPIIADRSEKLGFDIDRAKKIAIEAAEQCGRSDVPDIREPINLQTAMDEYSNKINLYMAEKGKDTQLTEASDVGVLVGPEGGWTDAELELLRSSRVTDMSLGKFTLRAETACVVAAAKILT